MENPTKKSKSEPELNTNNLVSQLNQVSDILNAIGHLHKSMLACNKVIIDYAFELRKKRRVQYKDEDLAITETSQSQMQRVLPRLITFDAVGSLMAPVGLEIRYKEIAKSHGLPGLDVSKAMCTFWLNYTRLRREQPIFGRNSGLGWRLWWCSLVNYVFSEQYPDISPVALNKLVDSVMECYSTRHGWVMFNGTAQLLLRLSLEPGLVLGVISNSDERLDRLLTCMNIRRYFSFVLTSYSLGAEKPDPAVFQEALHLSSRGLSKPITPSEALHVGNRCIDDYIGARGSGWSAILVNRNHKTLPPFVDERHVVTTLSSLHRRLQSIVRPSDFVHEPNYVAQWHS